MKGIMLKLWLLITITNLAIILLLGLAFGKLVHDFHFQLKAEDLRMIAKEVNLTYGEKGKAEALKYALAMAKHSEVIIEVLDQQGNPILATENALLNKKDIFSPVQQNALHKKSYNVYVGYVEFFKQEMIAVINPSTTGGFSTAIFTPMDSITSTINSLISLILYTCIGITLIMAIIAYLISRRISAPLQKLNKEALKIAEGQYDNLNVPKSKDEIGQLSDTILYVAENMQKTLTERETLSKVQKDFVANVSHDLRTPLSLIQGYAIALQEGIVEGKEKDQAVQIIIEESQRMHHLTNELLDLAKLEAGKQEFNFEPLCLVEITKKIIGNYSQLALEKNISLKISDLSNQAKVNADYGSINQVIINLLNNAIYHTPVNGIIEIKITDDNTSVEYEIHNSGSFISEEDIKHIWERFYKAEKARSPLQKGTGLGLAIVKGIVSAHQGEVGVASSRETGTTFWFKLRK